MACVASMSATGWMPWVVAMMALLTRVQAQTITVSYMHRFARHSTRLHAWDLQLHL